MARPGGSGRSRGFPIQQGTLAVHAPGVSGGRPVVADHTVARNGDRELVRGTSAGDGAHRVRSPDPLRELGITDRRAERDVLKRLPDSLLKRSAANVERQIETDLRRFHEADHARDHRLIVPVSADQTRLGETILKIADQLLRVIPEKNCNGPFLLDATRMGPREL